MFYTVEYKKGGMLIMSFFIYLFIYFLKGGWGQGMFCVGTYK